MIFRKIVVTAAIACLVLAFTACGDDDSSSFVEPEKESSDSGATLSGDSHEGSSPSSCSSKDDKSSSSVSSSSTNSSSSAKSSSSTDSKSSSSVTSSSSGTSAGSSAGNSSSSKARIPCSEEDESATLNGVDVICHDGYWVPVSSSSAAPTSSYFDMTNQFNEKVSYGEFTDPRDGQKYQTVEIYDKVYDVTYTIFAENLNFGKMVPGGTVLGGAAKYCYDDDPWYCDNGLGGLYTWSAAMNIPSICDSVKLGSEKCPYSFPMGKAGKMEKSEIVQQGICPEGWHIMNDNEWANLQEKSGNSVAYYMGSKVAGFGNNDYGLSILPSGYWLRYENNTSDFELIKKEAFFWLPQQSSDYPEKAHRVSISSREIDRLYKDFKSKRALSIRCVKNY